MKKPIEKKLPIKIRDRLSVYLLVKQMVICKILEKHWQQFILIYKYTNKQRLVSISLKQNSYFFYLQPKESISSRNYVVLARLIEFLDQTKNIKKKLRSFLKVQDKFFEIEKSFQIVFKRKSIFLLYFSFFMNEQINQFLTKLKATLEKSKISSSTNKLQFSNQRNFLVLNCYDFLLLIWFKNRIYDWLDSFVGKSQEKLLITNEKKENVLNNTSIFFFQEKHVWSPQNKRIIQIKKVKKKDFAKTSTNFVPFVSTLKKKYLEFIKHALQQSKIISHSALIQKLNRIFANWDSLSIYALTKHKARNLNFLLYHFLWQWALGRHRKKRAKWIKNRYLLQKKNNFFFSRI